MTTPNAWRRRSRELATWAWKSLVMRTDSWGGYLPLTYRMVKVRPDGTQYTLKSVTKPPVARRGQTLLTGDVIARHFAGWSEGDIIGLHVTSPYSTCKWIAVDVDAHTTDDDPERNLRFAIYIHDVLVSLGFSPSLFDADGKGGFHLWQTFADPIPAATAHRFAKWLVKGSKDHGFASPVESFPKSPRLHGAKLGNWLRLPGRHHTRPHWSLLWDERGHWLGDEETVAGILSTKPGDPGLIPREALIDPAAERVARPVHKPRASTGAPMDDRAVALACLDHIRNDACTHYDTWIGVGMALHSVDSGGGMRSEWETWSRRSTKHMDGQTEKWNSFTKDGGLTLGYLVMLAKRDGFDVFAAARKAQQSTTVKPIRWAGKQL